MNCANPMGSVGEKLLSYIDTSMQRDNNYQIAVKMLENYDALKDMSIAQIADMCYVSKASVSRFCRFLGYESFKEMHDALGVDYPISYDYSQRFFCNLTANPHATFLEYAREAQQNIAATISEKNLAELPKIAYAIHNCRRVAFFSHHFLWDTGRYLQNKLFSMEKVMDLYLDQASQLACAQSLQPEDLAIICSVGGSYPIRYVDVCNSIRDSKCSVLAITQNASNPYWNQAAFIMQCGESNANDTGKYGALAAIDLVVQQYLLQYGSDAFPSAPNRPYDDMPGR